MRLSSRYEISNGLLELWYSLLGLYDEGSDFDKINCRVHKLEELAPYDDLKALPDSSYKINEEIINFLYTACSLHSDDPTENYKQTQYVSSFINMLNASSYLDLIPDNSENYELHFRRLNTILLNSLRDLNQLSPDSVIQLSAAFNNGDFNYIISLIRIYKKPVYCLLLLSMGSNHDFPDYDMFVDDNSAIIDYDKFGKLTVDVVAKLLRGEIKINVSKSSKIVHLLSLRMVYPHRLSYSKSLELTKEGN